MLFYCIFSVDFFSQPFLESTRKSRLKSSVEFFESTREKVDSKKPTEIFSHGKKKVTKMCQLRTRINNNKNCCFSGFIRGYLGWNSITFFQLFGAIFALFFYFFEIFTFAQLFFWQEFFFKFWHFPNPFWMWS